MPNLILSKLDGMEIEHDGDMSVNWIVTTSADRRTWVTALFDSIDEARFYARRFVRENPVKPVIVEAVVKVETADFLNQAVRPHDISVAPNLWLERQFDDSRK